MGIILFLIARFLQWVLTPLFYLYAIFSLRDGKKIAKYFADVAFAIDQLGNVMGGPIMNDALLKKDPILLYGNPDMTISHVTGKNYVENKMTWLGRLIARMLNNAEPQHVEKAAVADQNNTNDKNDI
jgi:hypothetical protein